MLYMEDYDILTVQDVMKFLYIGKNTVYGLLQSGELKAFRIGKSWRIPRESLTEYIARQCISKE